jgi:hypothetical protein
MAGGGGAESPLGLLAAPPRRRLEVCMGAIYSRRGATHPLAEVKVTVKEGGYMRKILKNLKRLLKVGKTRRGKTY